MILPAVEPVAASGYRIHHRVLDLLTTDRMQLINITDRIDAVVRDSQIRTGVVHVQSLHTTASVVLNEWQDALLHDIQQFMTTVVMRDAEWRHNDPRYSDCERK